MLNGMISVNDHQSWKTSLAYRRQEKKVTYRKNDDILILIQAAILIKSHDQ